MMAKLQNIEAECPLEIGMNMITGKWKIPILWHLIQGRKRFNELQRSLPHITQKILTQQLREMENDGLVYRHVYAEVPPRVEYGLTPLGESIRPIFDVLCQWGKKYKNQYPNEKPYTD
jgi:DNA-binding HxlR family transcriptional regulator